MSRKRSSYLEELPDEYESHRGRRRHSVDSLQTFLEPPRSSRSRRHKVLGSYAEDYSSSEDLVTIQPSRTSVRSKKVIIDDTFENNDQSHKSSSSLRRSSRARSADTTSFYENVVQSHPKRGDVEIAPGKRRSARLSVEEDAENKEGDGHEEDKSESESEEEEVEDGGTGRKYSFRNRALTKRETMNVSRLGGDGGGLSQSNFVSSSSHERNTRNAIGGDGRNYRETPRLYLGGKILTGKSSSHNHSSRRHHRSSHRRRHFDSSSESSSSDDDRRRNKRHSHSGFEDEDFQFRNHENQRLTEERNSIQPINANGNAGLGGSLMDRASKRDLSRADVTPLGVESSVGFDSIGGLDKHIMALKEMVVLPLLYPDVFQRFNTQPPRGVLFVGPPGTGKTLTARALANSLSASGGPDVQKGQKVAFFMRKGADCLSKWVGEGERQLRLLFEQVKYDCSFVLRS